MPINDYKAYYKYENNTNDETGNFNLTAGSMTYEPRFVDQAQSGAFNGSTSKAFAPTSWAELRDLKTISTWIYLKGYGETNAGIICNHGGGDINQLTTKLNQQSDDNLYFHKKFSTTTGIWRTTSPPLSLTTKFHVGYTYPMDDNVATVPILYINGVSVAVTTVQAPVGSMVADSGSQKFSIGGTVNSFGCFFGNIDNTRLYDRVVSGAEFSAIYDVEKEIVEAKAYYKYEDNANDETGNHNGTASNITYETLFVDQGKSAVYNGTTSYIQVPDHADITDNKTAITLIFIDGTSEHNSQSILDKNGKTIFKYETTEQRITFEKTYSGTNGIWATDNDTILPQTVYIVAYTHDQVTTASPKLYIAGISVNVNVLQTPTGTPTSDTGGDLYIGNRSANDLTLNGKTDSTRLYQAVLPASEILIISDEEATSVIYTHILIRKIRRLLNDE